MKRNILKLSCLVAVLILSTTAYASNRIDPYLGLDDDVQKPLIKSVVSGNEASMVAVIIKTNSPNEVKKFIQKNGGEVTLSGYNCMIILDYHLGFVVESCIWPLEGNNSLI